MLKDKLLPLVACASLVVATNVAVAESHAQANTNESLCQAIQGDWQFHGNISGTYYLSILPVKFNCQFNGEGNVNGTDPLQAKGNVNVSGGFPCNLVSPQEETIEGSCNGDTLVLHGDEDNVEIDLTGYTDGNSVHFDGSLDDDTLEISNAHLKVDANKKS